ncbi:hypothetical protein HJG60_008724 [Phyllostomus discolor]|uniref:Uncharacterized protein n=1 Tax=Phyllostomus discolor TaxID=89673 RepID=A0A834DIV6_9CHIR|nr:hypothetical protein HJG60_008724 [Phyllostomus discolor]
MACCLLSAAEPLLKCHVIKSSSLAIFLKEQPPSHPGIPSSPILLNFFILTIYHNLSLVNFYLSPLTDKLLVGGLGLGHPCVWNCTHPTAGLDNDHSRNERTSGQGRGVGRYTSPPCMTIERITTRSQNK